MKVNPLTSVGAKLIYYMTALVVFTIAGNSFQFSKMFLEHQQNQVKDSIVTDAERAKDGFSQTIETWKSQIAVALPSLRGVDQKKSKFLINNFVRSSNEFISFEILEAPSLRSTKFKSLGKGFNSNDKDRRWSGREPKKVARKIDSAVTLFLKKNIPRSKKSNKILIGSIAKKTKLPIMITAARFEIAGAKTVVWGVLTTWQTNLIKSLPKSRFVSSKVIDSKSKVFTSHDEQEMIFGRISRTKVAMKALRAKTPSGFQDEYLNNGRRTLGGYARISDYGLTVVVERDAEKAYEALKKNLYATLTWALLFVLIGIMFAYWGATGITKGLRAVTHATTRIAAGDFGHRVPPKSNDEVGVLSNSINRMSSKIVNLMQSQVQQARIEKELETAKMVQSTFFPKQDILKEHLKVTGFYQPASECGGDLWGHYNIRDGVDFVYIADATGHGAPAALVTAIAYTTTKTLSDLMKDKQGDYEPPSAILERLNRIIYEAVEGSICMTFFGAIIDTNKGTLTFANAGHNLPILLPKKEGDDRAKKTSKSLKKISAIPPITLKQKGAPLGLEASSTFKDSTIELRHGDKIFFFTDGLIECQSPDNKVWGRKIMLENIMKSVELDARELKDEVLTKAFNFFGNQPLDDDVTVVVAELDSSWIAKTGDSGSEEPIGVNSAEQKDESIAIAQGVSTGLDQSTPLPPIPQHGELATEIKMNNMDDGVTLDGGLDLAFSLAANDSDELVVPADLPGQEKEQIDSSDNKNNIEPKPERRKFKIKLPSAG
jgi:serine phosphatase RsbU (regulator of sigma subunit)